MVNTMYDIYKKAYLHHTVKYGADTAIFYQVGKFYEMYDWLDKSTGLPQTSMQRAVEVLGIQLSPKKGEGPQGADALFSGVPEQSLHKYATLLTKAGWTVVIYDQVKDTKGTVTSRTVARILSPGTHIESAQQEAVYIAGIWLEEAPWGERSPPTFSVLATDLTTGRTITYDDSTVGKKDSWTADGAFHFFQVHQPRECIIWWRGDGITQPGVATLRRQFGLHSTKLQIEQADSKSQGSLEIPEVRENFLQKTISIRGLLPIREACGLSARPRTERILCCMFQRIQEMFPSGLKHLYPPEKWNPTSSLFLGNQALLQLNMVTPRMEDSILGLFQRTSTSFGLRAIRNRILYPVACPAKLGKAYDEIQTVLDWPVEVATNVVALLRGISDLPRIHRRASTGTLTPDDILNLDQSYICIKRLIDLVEKSNLAPRPGWNIQDIHSRLLEIFSIEKARNQSADTFCFQNERAPEVTESEVRIASLRSKLLETMETLRVWAGVPADSLELEERELSGPVITGNKSIMTVIQAKLRATTASGASQPFTGIQLIQKKSSAHLEIPLLESTYRELLKERGRLKEKIREHLPRLCDELSEASLEAWDATEEWVAGLDVTVTIARVSKELGFSRPELVGAEKSFVDIEGLRHPLIEACSSRTEYVKHNVSLTDTGACGWLIYGMNASGKSSLMKAVGISVLLAQAGCYVPCMSMRFTPFQSLFTRILNTDNLWAGLSSFAVEMTELKEILERAGENSLVLGDELCSGTESVSATAIVGAGIKWLHDRGAKFIFATHLHGLLDIPCVKELGQLKVWHLKVRYDPVIDALVYERTLTPGSGSSLYGLEVARAMNLPEQVLQMALTIRRGFLGIVNDSEALTSKWNSAMVRKECTKCGSRDVKNLEVHHIRPRAEATEGRFADGMAQDHLRNLAVLCSKCHDELHAGKIIIPPMVLTTKGSMRLEEDLKEDAGSICVTAPKSKWTKEQEQCIREYLKKYPNVLPKRAVFDLKEKGIQISAVSLRSFRM
jgi:DNA mismatch repair protein MutS